jgi:hypothetical protein
MMHSVHSVSSLDRNIIRSIVRQARSSSTEYGIGRYGVRPGVVVPPYLTLWLVR